MSIKLQTSQHEGIAVVASYATAASLITVPSNARPQAKAVFRHTGTAGYWYGKFARTTGPTTSLYSFKIGPGETFPEENMPLGAIWLLSSGDCVGDLSYSIGWRQ